MKSFKEYLVESKQVYEFKVKIAGDCPKDCSMQIKRALSKFEVTNCSGGKSTPIQETQVDFPNHKNVAVTIFDVATSYPATSNELRDLISQHSPIPLSCIKVLNLKEQEELELNQENDEPTGEALIEKDYEKSNNQDVVGDKKVSNLLKELGKTKTQGEQYKGVNDKLLAKKAPVEKSSTVKTEKKSGTSSTLSKVSNPDPRKGK